MNLFQPVHLMILAGVVVLFFGGKKLPELMKGIGQGVGELQKGLEESKKALHNAVEHHSEEPVPAAIETTKP